MAVRVAPTLPVPAPFAEAITACMAAKPLQHQDELVALLTWTQQLSPPLTFDTIVEIGSFRGGTLELWARLARDCVISVDLPTEQFYGSANTLDMMRQRDVLFAERFPHVYSVLADSHDPRTVDTVRGILAGASIDLLFIDGDHTPEGVAADYAMYAPLVRSGGVIAFHDTLWCDLSKVHRAQFGVPAFFDALPAPRFHFHAGGDWGGIGAIIA